MKRSNQLALKVAVIYIIVAVFWDFFSDELLKQFISNANERIFIDVIKDCSFAILTGGLLFHLLKYWLNQWEQEAGYRKRAEVAQEESEERYHRLFAVESDAIILVDTQTNQILEANPAAEKMYGFDSYEFLQLKTTDISAEPEKTRDAIATKASNIPLRMHRRKDGTIFPVEISCSDFDCQDQNFHVAAIRDITERKKAESALIKSEARYRGLFEHMNEGFAYCQMIFEGSQPKDFVYLEVNTRFTVLTGLKEVTGKRATQVIPGIHESDPEIFEIYGRVATTGKAEKFERFIQTLQMWFDISVYSTKQNFFFVVFDVITKRKQAEEELRWKTTFLEAQVDSALDGILVVDSQNKKILQNQRMAELLRIPKEIADDTDDQKQLQFVLSRVKNPEQFIEKVNHLFSNPDEVVRDEIELVDGTFLDRYSSPVRDKAGKHYGRIWTFRDITEHRKLEAQFRQSQKMEAFGQLAGGVAHDFNNILTVIHGNASMVLNAQLQPNEQTDCVRQVVQAAERAASLTRQLLLFSRKQAMHAVNLDLTEVVGGMTKMLKRILGEDIVLQTNFAPDLPPLLGDAGMIEQILLNLVVNSRDAMPKGGQLTVSTGTEMVDQKLASENPGTSPGMHIWLAVNDTGCGIAPENLARIFEPFFTTKEVGKGTGLGLATAYSIVQQHHGRITVTSEVGKGTTFRAYFPALANAKMNGKTAPALAQLPCGEETILLVEDDIPVRLLTGNVLQRCGYNVLQADSGIAALKVWQEHKEEIQLLLTDMIMPGGMMGRELAEHLGKEKNGLKVIYMSGYSLEFTKKELALEDGRNFLQKPFSPLKLAQTARNALNR